MFILIFNINYGQGVKGPIQDICPSYTIIPLRTFTNIPENQCYYLKDTDNELSEYEGTWQGYWNNKTIDVIISKKTKEFNKNLQYYKDYLVMRFKVTDNLGNILFDNTSIDDKDIKIKGGKFRKTDDKYSLSYVDKDLCNTIGNIIINFKDNTKSKLEWKYSQKQTTIYPDCFFYGTNAYPEPLPHYITLLKQ